MVLKIQYFLLTEIQRCFSFDAFNPKLDAATQVSTPLSGLTPLLQVSMFVTADVLTWFSY
jgi:hypothetical protein